MCCVAPLLPLLGLPVGSGNGVACPSETWEVSRDRRGRHGGEGGESQGEGVPPPGRSSASNGLVVPSPSPVTVAASHHRCGATCSGRWQFLSPCWIARVGTNLGGVSGSCSVRWWRGGKKRTGNPPGGNGVVLPFECLIVRIATRRPSSPAAHSLGLQRREGERMYRPHAGEGAKFVHVSVP